MIKATNIQNTMDSFGTFHYFGFGSNLSTKRILIQNPSAKRYRKGVLNKYRLDFYGHSNRWNGATATIVEDENEVVWGAIWTIDTSQMKQLDRQEGVHLGRYFPIHVSVITPDNETVVCRTYQLTNISPQSQFSKPSKTYLSVILEGAQESGLPEDYIRRLESIQNNGELACPKLLKTL